MNLSIIHYHHLKKFHDILPPRNSRDFIGAVFSNEEIMNVYRGAHEWRFNALLVPDVHPALPRETFTPPLCGCMSESDFENINTQGCFNGVRSPLKLYHFENIYFVQNGGGFIIFNEDGVSPFSTAIPNFLPKDCQVMGELDFGFFVGDKYSPENICHFSFDYIGRAILALNTLGIRQEDILFPSFEAKYSQHIFNLVTPRARILERGGSYFFRKLLMFDQTCGRIEHPARHCDKRILGSLRDAIGAPKAHWDKGGVGEVVYLNRLGEGRRPLANEPELIDGLRRCIGTKSLI